MPWEKPAFREITMSSEIGGYQEDFDQRSPGEPTCPDPAQPACTVLESVESNAVPSPSCG